MIYALSDIHGNQARFHSILEQINLQPEDTLYILGDVIDRNPDGIRVLRQIMAMPNAKMLMGNHESMMLHCLYYHRDEQENGHPVRIAPYFRMWYQQGGTITHQYMNHLRKSLREEIFEYLAALPVNIKVEVNRRKFILTHAAPTELFYSGRPEYLDENDYAIWHRYRGYEQAPEGYTVIYGHTPTVRNQIADPMRIWHDGAWICLDCGCASSNPESWGGVKSRLACLRLDDMKEFYSKDS